MQIFIVFTLWYIYIARRNNVTERVYVRVYYDEWRDERDSETCGKSEKLNNMWWKIKGKARTNDLCIESVWKFIEWKILLCV